MIVDAISVSLGFVLRAVAGAVAIGVVFSDWLLVCTILLALFLTFCKRRHELTSLSGTAANHRKILSEYSPYLLDQMIAVVTASCLTAYAFYTTAPETVEKFKTNRLSWTIPFVLYGIFRYLYLVHQKGTGRQPFGRPPHGPAAPRGRRALGARHRGDRLHGGRRTDAAPPVNGRKR